MGRPKGSKSQQFKRPKGFYYIDKSYEFHHLTDDEVDFFPEYILRQVEKDGNLGEGFAHLEEYQTHYQEFGQDVIYYVKVGTDYRGKLTVVYRIVGSGFWVQAYYYARSFQSLRQRASLRAPRKFNATFEHRNKPKNYHKVRKFGKEAPKK